MSLRTIDRPEADHAGSDHALKDRGYVPLRGCGGSGEDSPVADAALFLHAIPSYPHLGTHREKFDGKPRFIKSGTIAAEIGVFLS